MIPISKPFLGKEESNAAKEVILSGWVTQGPKVKEFEDAFARYVGAKHACAVSNCTTALHLALLTAGVHPGDVVLTVSHSFISTANSIRYCQAEPYFIDIDPQTLNISVNELTHVLENKCRREPSGLFLNGKKKRKVSALLVAHQIGFPCDLKSIVILAKTYQLPVIEDAACAAGSEISLNAGKTFEKIGRPHGDIACFSFHPRKVLTTGEGGMLTTQNRKYDEEFRLLRHVGMSVSDVKRHRAKQVIFEEYPRVGFNYRMTDIQAAIGIEQLKKLPAMIKKRRQIAEQYFRALSPVEWIQLFPEACYGKTNWQSFPVRIIESQASCSRDQLMQRLLDQNIATRPGIMNAHQEKPYQDQAWKLPASESARAEVLLLPLFHTMNKDDIKKITQAIIHA